MFRLNHHFHIVLLLVITLSPATLAQGSWHSITDQEGGFTISFPGQPRYQQIPNRQHGFTSESYSFFYQNHDLRISFVPLDPPPRTPREASKALNDSSAAYTTGFGRLLRQEKLPNGGRQYDNIYSSDGQSGYMRTRLYVRHGNLYTLSCTNDAADNIDERIAERFFSSFRFLEDLPQRQVTPQKSVTKRTVQMTGDPHWFVQRGTDGDFSVEFPGKPEYRLVDDQKNTILLHQYLSFFGNNHFIVSYRDKVEGDVTVAQVSQQSVQGLLTLHPGLRLTRQSHLPDGSYQVELQGMMAGEIAHIQTRLYMRGGRVYFVSSTTWHLPESNNTDVPKFFTSFRLR
jgi:hypothetical protein